MSDDTYEVYAVRYATMANRTRRENFLGIDPHDAAAMPIDYYVWVIRNAARTVVVDTGFDQAEGERRGRLITRLPRDGLAMLGVEAGRVQDVIVTHLHYDHAGTVADFPEARLHLQEAEMAYATGRCMTYETLRQPYSADHVCAMVRRVFDGRVAFHAGDEEILPGIWVHLTGGHAKGIQCVRVHGQRPAGPRLRHRALLREPERPTPLHHRARRRGLPARPRPTGGSGRRPGADRAGPRPARDGALPCA